MTEEQIAFPHWRELWGAVWTLSWAGAGLAALLATGAVGLGTLVEALQPHQAALALGSAGLVGLGWLVLSLRAARAMGRTRLRLGPDALWVGERQLPYAEIVRVTLTSEALSGFHRVAERTRCITFELSDGRWERVDLHNGRWRGVRAALVRHLGPERVGAYP